MPLGPGRLAEPGEHDAEPAVREPVVRPRVERAIDTRPDYALAHHWLGVVLSRLGEQAEADAQLRRARELGH